MEDQIDLKPISHEPRHLPLIDYLKEFGAYCLRPTHRNPEIKAPVYSTKNLIGGFFVLFLVYMILMAAMSSILGLDDIPHAMNDMEMELTPVMLFLVAVVMAPVIEEALFRYPLKWFTKGFAIAFYLFTLGFAALHIFNFTLEPSDYWKMPFLIIPQLVLGFYLGFVRMQFSWPHAVGIHALNNLIPTVMLLVAQAMGVDMM